MHAVWPISTQFAPLLSSTMHDEQANETKREISRKNSAVYSPSSNSLRMKYFTYYSWKERMREKKKKVFHNTYKYPEPIFERIFNFIFEAGK